MFRLDDFPIEENAVAERSIVNGGDARTLSHLAALRIDARPMIDRIADDIRASLSLRCEISDKSDASAQAKARRPGVLNRKPWFSIAHLRDYLRFRTFLTEPADVERVCDLFAAHARRGSISIVKIDQGKMLRPGPFGWRMIAIDIREAATGLIVEHYMTFGDLIHANEDWLHRLYEHWRWRDPEDLTGRDRLSLERDQRLSTHGYHGLIADRLTGAVGGDAILARRRGLTDDALHDALERMLK